ncbi:DUF222 domain-containing protein [Mycobacterium sp. TJFP1]
MFDESVPEPARLAGLSAAELIDAARAGARAENAACARKLAVMAEIFTRRTQLPAQDREDWWVDPEAAVLAELAAAQNITAGLASSQTHRGVALRDRLPNVFALFLAGLISDLLARTIVWRTALITDPALMAAVDAELAAQITTWGQLSAARTELAIDALVDRHDPDGVRSTKNSQVCRTLEFGIPVDSPGLTTIWARIFAGDAAAAQRRIDDMAHSVCPDDPRTLDDRRIEAYTALLAGITTLTCHCGNDDCEATAAPRPGRDTTIYVLTDTTTGNTPAADQADQNTRDRNEAEPATDTTGKAKNEAAREGEREDAAASEDRDGTEQTPAAKQNVRPHTAQCRSAYVFGAGLAPTALLEAMCEGATIREITHPGPDSAPEPRYTPSPALAAYIRCRDLTCRFPHCDTPATLADIDHTVPYPVGPTHPSNLKTLCRFHHLLKTFWLGATGWRDRQYPDGTIEWTAPTGHTYTTYPGSRLLFPALCAPTATLWTGEPPQTTLSARRGAMMPKRRNTRAHNRSRYIEAQRRRNRSEKICTTRSTDIARGRDILYRNTLHQFHPPGHEPDYGNDPPPF